MSAVLGDRKVFWMLRPCSSRAPSSLCNTSSRTRSWSPATCCGTGTLPQALLLICRGEERGEDEDSAGKGSAAGRGTVHRETQKGRQTDRHHPWVPSLAQLLREQQQAVVPGCPGAGGGWNHWSQRSVHVGQSELHPWFAQRSQVASSQRPSQPLFLVPGFTRGTQQPQPLDPHASP